jgi:chitinase
MDMKKRILFVLTSLLIAVSGIQSKAQFKIVGYIPNWTDLTTFSNTFDFIRATHLNIAFKNPNASGDLPALSTSEAYLVSTAHYHGVKVLISLGGSSTGSSGTLQSTYFNLINSTNRSVFCSKLKQYAVNNNLDGIDVDIEGSGINSDYGGFIQVLADSLHSAGKLLTAALSEGYGGASAPSSIFNYLDWINIMAYDACALYWCTTPANHSTYQFAVDNLNYWKGRGLAQSKAVLGVPFYGYGFNSYASTNAYPFSYIAANFPSNVYDDQAGNIIYYNGLITILNKTSLAVSSGGGIMIWDLSLDATGNNSLLKVIVEKATGYTLTATTPGIGSENSSVYPNPSNGIIELQNIDLKNTKTEIYNTLGEKVIAPSEGNTIDLSNEPKGIYYLHIIKEDNVTLRKIVLQ